MIEILTGILISSYELLTAMAPYLLFGFLFAGILSEFISADNIARHLGKNSIGSVIKAALFGIPLPLCSCGVIPPTMALRKSGASKGSVLSFLIATPTTGIDSIFATYALLGPVFAVYRVVASFVAAVFSGVSTNLLDKSKETKEMIAIKDPLRENKAHRKSFIDSLKKICHYAFVELMGDIATWLLVGIVLGGIITFIIPDDFFNLYLGSGWQAMIVMLIIGVPLYVCATGSIPVAAALLLKGINPGAAFVFLLVGPATNAVTMTVVSQYLGKKTTVIYVTTLVISSLLLGFVLDVMWGIGGFADEGVHHIHHQIVPGWLELGSAGILMILLVFALMNKRYPTLFKKKDSFKPSENNMLSQFKVSDMSCQNCVAHIKSALEDIEGIEHVSIELSAKDVKVHHEDNVKPEKMIQAIKDAGYTVLE